MRNNLLIFFFSCITVFYSPLTQAGASPSNCWGKPIRYIRLESRYPIPQEQVFNLIACKEGDVLTPVAIRKSLRNLYHLKKFHQIRVSTAPFLDGVAITFTFEHEWLIKRILFKGKHSGILFSYGFGNRVSLKEIQRACGLHENDFLSEGSIDKAITAIKKLYLSYGYGRCRVEKEIRKLEKTHEVNIVFNIERGEKTKINSITFEGNTLFSDKKLRKVIHSKVGRRFVQNKLETDIEKLRNFYYRHDFIRFVARLPTFSFNDKNNTVDIVFKIDENIPVDISLRFPRHLWNLNWWIFLRFRSNRAKLRILGLQDNTEIDDALLESSTQRLKDAYIVHGYSNADAKYNKNPELGKDHVIFDVSENEKVKIKEIHISGNHSVSKKQIMRNVLSKAGKIFNPYKFEEDCKAIELFYKNSGFQNVKVSQLVEKTNDGTNEVILNIQIKEGIKQVIHAFEFSGNTVFSQEELLSIAGLRAEMAFNPSLVEEHLNNIKSKYLEKGYIHIRITYEIQHIDASRKRLVVKIQEGHIQKIDKIIIRGNRRAKFSIIRDKLYPLQGKPLNIQTLIEAQHRLTRTGLFSSAKWILLPDEDAFSSRNIIFHLTERPSLYLEAGPGYNTDTGFNGCVNFFTPVLFGTERYLGSSIFLTEKTGKSQIIYREPEFGGYPLQLEVRFYRNLSDEDGYRLFQYGGKANWTYRLSRSLRMLLEYRLDENRPVDIGEDTILPVDLRNPVRIGSLAPALLFDCRDDPRNPHSGSLISVKIEFARPVYDSEVNFTKIVTQALHFFKLHDEQTLGVSFRLGWGNDLPLQEKFKLGGIKTIRGWGYEDIKGEPIPGIESPGLSSSAFGGNCYILGNIEFRIPLVMGLMGVVFIDSGNVWDDLGDFEMSELKMTLGAGLRFMTPVGPIGIDYGYNIVRESDDPNYRWSFIIGHSF